ncbi:STAS domain-containing protein [Prauserella sp. ASG 168]|uniref:STAS domain-containing protein n=1 Tax=Prauserella cavernicola TaxID=2800127 RepID=A0A934V3X4_9PSEU|nr:STAS domain-containing protein [Prauserella cavernicola]
MLGEIDAATLAEFGSELAALPHRGAYAVVVDLARVRYCSCAGARELLDLRDRAEHAGVPLALAVETHAVRRVLDVLGVAPLFTLRRNARAALTAAAG